MQTKTGQVHIRGRGGSIEPRKNGDHAARVVVLMKAFQSFVANRPDHNAP
jgi:hypothetical protein